MARSVKVFFKCEVCAATHRWRPHLAGKRAKCRCGHVMTVPKGRPIAEPKSIPREAAPIAASKPPAAKRIWRWWFPVAMGGLIAAFALYESVSHGLSALELGGLILAALAVLVGFWSRPSDA